MDVVDICQSHKHTKPTGYHVVHVAVHSVQIVCADSHTTGTT